VAILAGGALGGKNVGANDQVALLWPAPEPGEHALLVNGRGAVHETPDSESVVLIEPARAVLHVPTPARV